MVEDLIFRAYENVLNLNRRNRVQAIWARERKKEGADMVNQYILNRYPMDKQWTILNKGNN
jgi:hypothetical protein